MTQHVVPVVDRQGLVQMFTDQHRAAGHTEAKGLLWDLETAPLESHGIVVVHDAFLLLRKDLLQVLSRVGHKRRSGLFRLDTETGIVEGDPILAEKIIGRLHRCDVSQPELLR